LTRPKTVHTSVKIRSRQNPSPDDTVYNSSMECMVKSSQPQTAGRSVTSNDFAPSRKRIAWPAICPYHIYANHRLQPGRRLQSCYKCCKSCMEQGF